MIPMCYHQMWLNQEILVHIFHDEIVVPFDIYFFPGLWNVALRCYTEVFPPSPQWVQSIHPPRLLMPRGIFGNHPHSAKATCREDTDYLDMKTLVAWSFELSCCYLPRILLPVHRPFLLFCPLFCHCTALWPKRPWFVSQVLFGLDYYTWL